MRNSPYPADLLIGQCRLIAVDTDRRPHMVNLTSRYCPGAGGGERTSVRVTHWRRLVCDYEQRLDVSEAMMHRAMASDLSRRLTT
jgi:hypothetical protein